MTTHVARLTIGLTLALSSVVAAGCGGDDDAAEATTGEAYVELPTEAAEVYEGYVEALHQADGEAMLEYVTDDFTWLSYGTNLMDAEYRADYVTKNYGAFEVTEVGERVVVGGGDEYIFSVAERATTPVVADGISLVKMVRIDGEWLVAAQRFLGEGTGSA